MISPMPGLWSRWLILFCAPGVLGASAAPPEAPPTSMKLLVLGGPVPVDVEVLVNDRPVATAGDGTPLALSLDPFVVPGANRIRLVAKALASPRAGQKDLRLRVAFVLSQTDDWATIENVAFDARIPKDAPLAGLATCVEESWFEAGPPPELDPARPTFGLIVTGAQGRHRVAVKLNGHVVLNAMSGYRSADLTPFLVKGENVVEFEGGRVCFPPRIPVPSPLTFHLGRSSTLPDRTSPWPVRRWEIEKAYVAFKVTEKEKRDSLRGQHRLHVK
jgi:hypothetical protein